MHSVTQPTVTAVIPAFNAARFLPDCLQSVRSQVFDGALEIVVVDDGSTDDTAMLARACADVLCLSQPQRGPSAARNAGLRAARGEFIAFLDADDLWPPHKLARQLAVLRAQPTAALVVGDCRQFDAHGPLAQTEFEQARNGEPAWGRQPLVPDAYRRLLENNFITTGSVVARRDALLALEGFAEDLRLVEDLELWLRLARGHAVAWCREVCLLRRRHDSNSSRDAESMALAFLAVLQRQPAGAPGLARHVADAHAHLVALALGQGRYRGAMQHAWLAMRSRKRPDTVWRLLRAGWHAGLTRRQIRGVHGAH